MIARQDVAKYLEVLEMAIGSWTRDDWRSRSQLREGFLRHNQYIRSIVPPERLLEFRSEDGWVPLCNFLDKPVPAEAYPYTNAGDNLAHYHYFLIAATTLSLIIRWMLWLAPACIVIFMAWYAQKRFLGT